MTYILLALLAFVVAGSVFRAEKPAFVASPLFRGFILFALVFVVALIFAADAGKRVFPFDDSYISMSAARNVARHFELSVVSGRPLQGITSPLHVLLVGFIGTLAGVEIAARALSLIAFFAACLGTGLLAKKITGDKRAFVLASGLCLYSGPMLYDVGSGMETSLFTALLIWTVYLFEIGDQSKKYIALRGVMAGLCVLTRPEGIFLAAAVCGVPLIRAAIKKDKKEIIALFATGGVALVVCLPYWIANLAYTGHILPSSVSAKAIFFRKGESSIPNFADLEWPFKYFFRTAQIVGLVAMIGLALRKRLVEISFILLFYVSYLVRFPDSLKHYRGRYQHPLWPLIALGATLLIYWAAKKTKEIFEKKGWPAPKVASGIICAGLAGWMLFETMYAATFFKRNYVMDTNQTIRCLRQTVDYVNRHAGPGQLIATHDVGAMIYWGVHPVLDIVGLSDESIAKRLAVDKVGMAGIGPILFEKRPAYLVLLRKWEDDFLLLTKTAPEGTYHLIWSSPVNAATGAIYDVYQCNWHVAQPTF